MTPLDMAMKLASASSRCEKHKCPFMGQCKGDYATCVMKEIALIIRSQNADIETLKTTVKGLNAILLSVHQYTLELEKINKRYHDIVLAFQGGYRPKKKIYRPKKKPAKPKPKKDPTEMDGDERYAYEPPRTTEPQQPMVVI